MNKKPLRGLAEREQLVRDLVNELHETDRRDTRDWFEMCAAMDSVGDTALVLDSKHWRRKSREFAPSYLRLYGLLEAIYSQQKSILHLWELHDVPRREFSPASAWTRLRRLRNDLTAHSGSNAGSVSRISLRSPNLHIIRWSQRSSGPEFTDVPLDQLVESYLTAASRELDALADHLSQLIKKS